MKTPLLVTLGTVFVLLQAGTFFAPTPAVRLIFVLGSVILVGVFCLHLHRLSSTEGGGGSQSSPVAPVAAPPVSTPVPPEAELVAFLALLQEQGRLVDFVREDLAGATDAEVGAAARVVHAGCRRVLDEAFTIEAVRSEAEGTVIELPLGYDAPAYRLLGQVAEEPPYRGVLRHPGWRAVAVKLPQVTGVTPERPWPVLAPAEVEIRRS